MDSSVEQTLISAVIMLMGYAYTNHQCNQILKKKDANAPYSLTACLDADQYTFLLQHMLVALFFNLMSQLTYIYYKTKRNTMSQRRRSRRKKQKSRRRTQKLM